MSTASSELDGFDGRTASMQERYETVLWGVMERIGIAESLERKIMAAVLLQFLSTLAVFALPLAFLGPRDAIAVFPTAQIVLTGLVFALSVVAFVNTLLIARRDVVGPILSLRTAADAIASGRLDDRPERTDQSDEIGDLQRSFDSMHAHLRTVAAQADALACEEFDADVLEERVPGEFGDSLEAMQTGLQDRIGELEESRQQIDRQRERVEQRNATLEADAERIRAVLDRCRQGDFTRRVTAESDHDAMNEIADGLNETLDDIEGTLHGIQTLALEVEDVGREVSQSVRQIEAASEDVSQSAEEISIATDEQNDRFEDVLGEMSDLSATIEEIAATADGVADVSAAATERAQAGRETATDALDELDRIERRAGEIVDRIETLEDDLSEAGDIVDVIDGIAEETNLLAINASVEAARAGADGKRFAVVATEVRSLAEETSDATDDVDAVVGDVQSSAGRALEEIRTMRREVVEGVETIEESLDALTEIADRVQDANEGIQSIDDATDEQARSSQQVVTMVDTATERSERTLKETSSVAAAVEEQTATIADIAGAAESLSERATELSDRLEEFTVEE
ncbi:HAMP domain-containing methyl-accepting chemotaxis protein [Natrialba sp. INN-245]|uniref:methyl-accepting chemotaxis protein n=1 Tax=Natrialba sp. INN-245 TaxID=2690967 RepID=UPI001310FD1C|nr:HAMP domain-containing methyl-accepting chemotaxis protein [Natrialba sp. INN-245]MWV39236.1 HAMP domain-containing protein [Natrialba sp. INN-245]